MEIMEDGNLVDRVRILLQRDMQYYQEMQTVLREPLCVRVSGGKLDFPRHASFASIKIVTWWEAEFLTAFKKSSGLNSAGSSYKLEDDDGAIKRIKPDEFVLLVVDTAGQLMEHLHTLIQESLDHADLTVLTATLGAAALVRNSLWCYNQHAKGVVQEDTSEKLNKSYKSYNEMAEAVAERLLDLHCRLISLYILNEADSLSWHSDKPFFEKERCSFVIQMWWLYMQGTKADLWNSVSPKMAQRVFSGMLNESLTILTTRFVHGRPSLTRSEQFWSDAFNVLRCTGYLALGACVNGDEMIGTPGQKLPVAIRDVHAKCNELLLSLLLRGTPIRELYQAFRRGLGNLTILQPARGLASWLLICAPNLLGQVDLDNVIRELPQKNAVILELNVLRHQPQPNWPQLMKVISMNNYAVAKILMKTLVRQCIGYTTVDESKNLGNVGGEGNNCNGFLCPGTNCQRSFKISAGLGLYSLTHILVMTMKEPENVIIPALKEDSHWADYLHRQQVWNQVRPPWLNAIVEPLKEMMGPIVELLLSAVKTGASIYQAMSLALGCFAELHATLPLAILRAAIVLDENLPAHCRPLGGSVLLQILCAALYSELLKTSAKGQASPEDSPGYVSLYREISCFDWTDKESAAGALAEAICSIDEDNKHTEQIDSLLTYIQQSVKNEEGEEPENTKHMTEIYTDELLFSDSGRRSLKVTYEYIVRASDWLLAKLQGIGKNLQEDLIDLPAVSPTVKPLTYVMFHIEDSSFDQFLTDYEGTNWRKVFSLPLSLNLKRLCSQVLLRPEFKNIAQLERGEREAVMAIKRMCTEVKSARFE